MQYAEANERKGKLNAHAKGKLKLMLKHFIFLLIKNSMCTEAMVIAMTVDMHDSKIAMTDAMLDIDYRCVLFMYDIA